MSAGIARVDWPVKHCPENEQHEIHVWGPIEIWGQVVTPLNSFLCDGKGDDE